MRIGEVARATGIAVETIRYYEREALIGPPDRLASGYRVYDATVLREIRFIQRAKDLGFTLAEIRDLLALRIDDPRVCGDVKRRAEAKIDAIEAKIRSLHRMRRALDALVRACARPDVPSSACPILDAIEGDEG